MGKQLFSRVLWLKLRLFLIILNKHNNQLIHVTYVTDDLRERQGIL
jgi:hypothetical protein